MTYLFPTPSQIGHQTENSDAKPLFWVPTYRTARLLLPVADFFMIIIAGVIADFSSHAFGLSNDVEASEFVKVGAFAALLFMLAIHLRGRFHTSSIGPLPIQFGGIFFVWSWVLLIITAFLLLLGADHNYSLGSLLILGFVGLGSLAGSRAFVARKLDGALARGLLWGHRAVVIGEHGELANTSDIHLLQRYASREIGRFELLPKMPEQHSLKGDDLAVLDDAISFARENGAEIIFLALGWTDTRRCEFVRERLQILPLPVFLLPDRLVCPVLGLQTAIELQRAPLSDIELITKRVFDLVLATVGLVALLPLLALVSLSIKLSSPGPVIFRQHRHGFNRRKFAIYKFRTMNVQENGSRVAQVRRNDARVTSLGRFLRATSIDELPQLVNVLLGDMSLVGPRPHACAHDEEYAQLIGNYAFRHHIKPGITGWAQVNGLRGETPHLDLMKRRVELDIWYINNWSMWLDLRILVRTCVELASRNAY